MKIVVAYLFPNLGTKNYCDCARRFTNQYLKFPPGETDHELYVIVNGQPITPDKEKLFEPLAPKFIQHDNYAKDIGAFRMASETIPCDLLICVGAPARPRMAGWLDIITDSFLNNGPGFYGCWGFHEPAIHLRTTVFWVPPTLLNAYPEHIHDDNRYSFEHGTNSMTMWCLKSGWPVNMVTAKGTYPVAQWHHVRQEDSLYADQHCDRAGWIDEGGGW